MTLTFPDVSHYQAGLNLKGAPAVIAKCSQGADYRDPAYVGFRAQASALGLPFCAYHWVTTDDLSAQAANARAIGAGNTPLMWDAEAAGATVPRLVELTYRLRQLGGNPRLVYLPHWWWQELGSPDLRPLAAAGLGLVSSNYPAGGYSDSGPGWASYGGVTPVIWQYTDRQQFNGQRVDFNAFKGTAADLRSLLTATSASPTLEADVSLTLAQNNALAEAWSTAVALRDGVPVPAAGAHAAGPAWIVEQIQAVRAELAALGAAVAALAPPQAQTAIPHKHLMAAGETGPAIPTP